jgi:hypothetical protein
VAVKCTRKGRGKDKDEGIMKEVTCNIAVFKKNPVYILLQTGVKMRSLVYYEYRRCSW